MINIIMSTGIVLLAAVTGMLFNAPGVDDRGFGKTVRLRMTDCRRMAGCNNQLFVTIMPYYNLCRRNETDIVFFELNRLLF